MSIGEIIRLERERKGWNRSTLARESGVSPSVIGQIEEGTSHGRADIVLQIARALEVEADSIARLIGNKPAALRYTVSLDSIAEVDRVRVRRAIDGVVEAFRRSAPPSDLDGHGRPRRVR